jgi:hypothetical protein
MTLRLSGAQTARDARRTAWGHCRAADTLDRNVGDFYVENMAASGMHCEKRL